MSILTKQLTKPQKPIYLDKLLKKRNPNIVGNYMVTEKIDGWYGYMDYTPELGWGPIKSFADRIIPSMEWHSKNFAKYYPAFPASVRLIFEIHIPNTPFPILNGLLNRKYEPAYDAYVLLHDIIFFNNQSLPAGTRFSMLSKFKDRHPLTQIVELLDVTDNMERWKDTFTAVTNRGGEGIVLKQCEGLYYFGNRTSKRNESLIKWKLDKTFDLEVVGTRPTVGDKGEPSLNLILRRRSGVEIEVVVGKKVYQMEWKANPSAIIGQIVQVRAMGEYPDGALREPRLNPDCCIRYDLTLADLTD